MLLTDNLLDEQELTKRVRELLAEGTAEALARESSAFDKAAAPGGKIVLFGAGGLGRRALSGLRAAGVEPSAFSDNNPGAWGTTIDGLKVLPPEVAAREYGRRATFVITIWGALGTDRMGQREAQLRALGCEYVLSFPPLFWKHADALLPHYAVDLPHKVQEQSDEVIAASSLWADDDSRREYLAQLRFRLHADFGAMPEPVRQTIYFPHNLWRGIDHEVFIDCGAYDGDTIASLLEQPARTPPCVFSFEPDPENFAQLAAKVARLPQRDSIVLHQAAVGARASIEHFAASASASSRVGEGDLAVKCVALDEALCGVAPTYIKMDIEGSELQALAGAAKIIRRHAPLLAISAYHRQDDLWLIPLFIHSLNRDYRLFLRPHRIEGWDLVCYAIPESRLSQSHVSTHP